MNGQATFKRWAGAALVLWLAVVGCGVLRTASVGELRTETRAVDLGTASAARVRIEMGAGALKVAGGADQPMQASFRYNIEDWQPRVNYTVNGSQGELAVDHEDRGLRVGDKLVNEWRLSLNNAVPIDLQIDTGAGETELDLRGLALTALQVEVGAGNAHIDLSSSLDHDLSAAINSGVGELSVKLPGEMGVRVAVSTGIGDLTNAGLVKDGDYYVNAAYGVSPHTLFLKVDNLVGAVYLLAP
jgi:hypothetical protein